MRQEEVGIVAVGAGPANLALAVALEELAPDELAANTLLVEQHEDVAWQRGMLLPWTESQVSFLKDLVTLRNPRSQFSFVNYLYSVGRLDEFINLGTATPYRLEISNYLRWVARSLTRVRVRYGQAVIGVQPCVESGMVTGWQVQFADGDQVRCRDVVVGIGREPRVPQPFNALPPETVVHSAEFTTRLAKLDRERTRRIVVIGAAQSAAEMLWAAYQTFPDASCTMVMRSIGLQLYETSKFTNELFYPSFVDEFHGALPEARSQLLREMRRTNYAGLTPSMLDGLYRQIYQDRLSGTERLSMIPMTDVVDAAMVDGDVVLTLRDRRTGRHSTLACDLVLLGTGFRPQMPPMVRQLVAAVGAPELKVDRNYRVLLPPEVTARCYVQGVNEETHGIADSLISVLAVRSAEIVADLLAGHDTDAPFPARSAPDVLTAVTNNFGGEVRSR
ncbi:MAG TPA: SidA/IucD/PvdA family monooxygenase [Pseudonocardiaceae bacterium]|nr:SidA/IucD/PvdA family monooxygenase [Pseudonocardiaceae bacterium]